MKKIINLLLVILMLTVFTACQEDIDVNKLTDFAPGIASITPTDGGKVVLGNFDIKVMVADGSTSTLADISVTLLDADGETLYSVSQSISGTSDSIVVSGTDFSASDLAVGSYNLRVIVKDVKDQVTDVTTSFEISLLPYAAINDVMYISGDYNSWGSDVMELVADYTWEIQNIDLQGGEWKFKNTTDWTDLDWGDSDCDGVMEEFGSNSNCGHTGLVNIQFNDQTLEYTIEAAVTIETNVTALYLLGSFNDFQGDEYAFTSTEDHIWVLDEVELHSGDSFRFSEEAYGGTSFGDNEPDSIADESAPNIVMPDGIKEGIYSITFNDETLAYSLSFLRSIYPSQLYILGISTSAGWDEANPIPMIQTGDGYFEVYAYLENSGDDTNNGFKFIEDFSWDNSWGMSSENEEMLVQGGNNIPVSVDGFYRIDVNFVDGTFSVTSSSWGIVGDATGSWEVDTNMTLLSAEKGNYTWTIDISLSDGGFKFRENGSWDVNYGDSGADGTLDSSGDDIIVSAGRYTVQMTLDPVNGYTYTIE